MGSLGGENGGKSKHQPSELTPQLALIAGMEVGEIINGDGTNLSTEGIAAWLHGDGPQSISCAIRYHRYDSVSLRLFLI